MRVATWNLDGRWTPAHAELIATLDADVLLLAEVGDRLDLPHHHVHRTAAEMLPGKRWAAVASRNPLRPLPDPHVATAAATTEGWTFACSVLPWKGSGGDPWGAGPRRRPPAPADDAALHRPRRGPERLEHPCTTGRSRRALRPRRLRRRARRLTGPTRRVGMVQTAVVPPLTCANVAPPTWRNSICPNSCAAPARSVRFHYI